MAGWAIACADAPLRLLQQAGDVSLRSHPRVQAELCVRVSVFILKAHQAKLMASPGCKTLLADVQTRLRDRIENIKSVVGLNMAGLRHLQAVQSTRQQNVR